MRFAWRTETMALRDHIVAITKQSKHYFLYQADKGREYAPQSKDSYYLQLLSLEKDKALRDYWVTKQFSVIDAASV